jgi:hypothetical protein
LLSYPSFPTYSGSATASAIGSYILQIVLWFVEVPLIGIANVFIAFFDGLSSGAGSSVNSIIGFPGQIFQSTIQAFSALGIFAPIAAALVWGVALVILIFFIFKAIQLALAESTEDV